MFGRGGGKYGVGIDRKQLITMRLLASPPLPCVSFVNIPRSIAIANTTSLLTRMMDDNLIDGFVDA